MPSHAYSYSPRYTRAHTALGYLRRSTWYLFAQRFAVFAFCIAAHSHCPPLRGQLLLLLAVHGAAVHGAGHVLRVLHLAGECGLRVCAERGAEILKACLKALLKGPERDGMMRRGGLRVRVCGRRDNTDVGRCWGWAVWVVVLMREEQAGTRVGMRA